jgi:hypothetical protein
MQGETALTLIPSTFQLSETPYILNIKLELPKVGSPQLDFFFPSVNPPSEILV